MEKYTLLIIVLVAIIVTVAIFKYSQAAAEKAKRDYITGLANASAAVAAQKPTAVGVGAILNSIAESGTHLFNL